MKKTIDKIFSLNIVAEFKDEFNKEIIRENNMRCQIVLFTICGLMLPWLIIEHSNLNLDYFLSLIIFFIEIAALFILFFLKDKKYIGAIHISIMTLCLIWSQYVTFSQNYMGDYMAYFIGLAGLSLVAFLKPQYVIVLFGINHFVFIILNIVLIHERYVIADIIVNSSVGVVFACIAAVFNYRSKLNSFLNKKLIQELNIANEKLFEYVHIDAGTGIFNRRAFLEKLDLDWENAKSSGERISLIMIDVDFFKQYNDTYGHSQGDVILKEVASSIKEHSGENFAGRYGGEEFVVLLPYMEQNEAVSYGETIRQAVEMRKIPHEGRKDKASVLTISLGVASMLPDDKNKSQQLIDCADKALYAAKEKGRNQVVVL